VAALRPGDGPGLPQVRLRLAVPELAWDLIAPSTCELLDAAGRAKLVGRLGPDPLRSDRDPDEAYRRVVAHRCTIAAAQLRRVYKQELCYDCGTPIVAGTINGRATYACPRCQPEWAG
jgi:formamidopyrimidine-DNA glycosylase